MGVILFRGLSKYGNYWVEGSLIQGETRSYILQGNPRVTMGLQILAEVVEVIPESVEQYAGFYDNNGNKIFKRATEGVVVTL